MTENQNTNDKLESTAEFAARVMADVYETEAVDGEISLETMAKLSNTFEAVDIP